MINDWPTKKKSNDIWVETSSKMAKPLWELTTHMPLSLSQMMKNKQRMKILFPLLQQWEDVLMHSSSNIQFWLQYGQKEESYEPS